MRSVPIVSIVSSYGLGLSTALTVSTSAAKDTDTPSFTRPAACLRLDGVMRFRAPIWSSLPQRPQFDRSVSHRSYAASVTMGRGVGLTWDESAPTLSPTISTTRRRLNVVLMLPP